LQAKSRPRVADAVWQTVCQLLRLDWSPEQISLWLAQERQIGISPEWIYQYIFRDKQFGGRLHRHLRGRRRKQRGARNRLDRIKNRVSIDERPAIVDSRRRLGDWEVDTIIGTKRSGALVSLTERKSRYVLIAKLKNRSATALNEAVLALLEPMRNLVHTITSDNGSEFSYHEVIAQQLDARFYFAHPYSAWERGTNENANGLIRQYFPKRRVFSTISDEELALVMNRINNRPRKCLAMQTPNQVLCGINPQIALTT
jgi:IS30 family transposase